MSPTIVLGLLVAWFYVVGACGTWGAIYVFFCDTPEEHIELMFHDVSRQKLALVCAFAGGLWPIAIPYVIARNVGLLR